MAVQEAQPAYTALRACLSRVRRRAARTVLRGAGRSNALRLPGEINLLPLLPAAVVLPIHGEAVYWGGLASGSPQSSGAWSVLG
jgi:hypothetical protein